MQGQDVKDMKNWAELQGKNAENAAIDGVQPSNIVNVEVQEMNCGKDGQDDMSRGVGTPSVRPASTAIPWYMYMIAATASLNSIDYGFDVGVSSGVALYLREGFELEDVEVGMFFSIVPIAAALGAMVAQSVSDRFGRKGNFLATQFVGIAGVLLCSFSVNYDMILVGRFLVGISVGIGMSIDPMYISETAPA